MGTGFIGQGSTHCLALPMLVAGGRWTADPTTC